MVNDRRAEGVGGCVGGFSSGWPNFILIFALIALVVLIPERNREFGMPVTAIKPDNRLYTCKLCNLNFTMKSEFSKHRSNHPLPDRKPVSLTKRFNCTRCTKTYKSSSSLQKHMRDCTGKLKCPFEKCNYSIPPEECWELIGHLQEFHRINVNDTNSNIKMPKKVRCPNAGCNRSFIYPAKLRFHLQRHKLGISDLIKTKIDTHMERNIELTQNALDNHNPMENKCYLCVRYFSSETALNNHMRTHTGEKPFECNHCGDRFRFKVVLEAHERRAHGSQSRNCTICGRAFAYNSNMLKHHMRSHNNDRFRSLKCKHCNYRCGTRGELTKHVRKHTGEKPFTCLVCGQRFSDNSNCRKHQNAHYDHKPFKCKVCGMSFTQKISTELHMRVHTGMRPFECPDCPKKFAQYGNLLIHSRIHTGEKPFPCLQEGCNQTFRYTRARNSHMAEAHNIKDFINRCPICYRNFPNIDVLNMHLSIHDNNKTKPPFMCYICGDNRRFDSRRAMVTHFRVHTSSKKDSDELPEVQAVKATRQSSRARFKLVNMEATPLSRFNLPESIADVMTF